LTITQPEADRTVSLTAVKVVDEQRLYLLGHKFSISSPAASSTSANRNSQERNYFDEP